MEPAEHARWLGQQAVSDSLVATGERVFRTRGCSGCHAPGSAIHAPLLEGLYGRKAPLADGTLVTADEQYLRDSIVLPNKQIAAGYQPIMPTYQGQISEEELSALMAYLKSIGEKSTP
jgi:cytochrome c oxidase subunit 2